MYATNSEAMRAFASTYDTETAPVGETITLPDTGQVFTILAQIIFDYGAGHLEPAGYQWSSPCAVCGDNYLTMSTRSPAWLKRTCPACAGQWQRVKPPASKPCARRVRPRSALMNHVLAVWEALQLAQGGEVRKRTFIEYCAQAIPAPPAGERDVRRQNVARSLDRLLRNPDDSPFTSHGDKLVPRENDSN